MIDKNFIVKTAAREEVDIAVDWARQEGWNPGLHDADSYYCADSNGFLIGYLDSEPIATISVIKYDKTFGFLGFYIVKPEYRGRGYGWRIWQAGLEYLKGCNIGLDGVVEQQENYKKSGFKLAFRNIRYQACGGGQWPGNTGVVELNTLPFDTINAYSKAFFPADRAAFIQAWITQDKAVSLGIIQSDVLAAYGVLRACHTGYKVGPLFADSAQLADTLFQSLRSKASPSNAVYLDVPEVNVAAVELAQRYDMNVVFETARMYTGQRPEMPLPRIFGMTSFEIG